MNRHAFMVLTAGLLVAGSDPREEAAKRELRQLEGTWKIISAEANGKKVPPEELGRYQLLIEPGGRMTALKEGRVTLQGSMALDPTRMPKNLDVTFTQGEQSGKTSLGIYEIKDGAFTFCRASPGRERPSEFASKLGTGITLITYERRRP
jgi:uncharacterized protein (TIGR03067 family)